MDDVRQSIRRSVTHIIGIASKICTEIERSDDCDNPNQPCIHQKALTSEVWETEANKTFYANMSAHTPNQIRGFWVGLGWLRRWLFNASSAITPYFADRKKAQREAEIFGRKWDSSKGPLGVCLYCDADRPTFPTSTRTCRREYCRAEYGIWVAQMLGKE